jgi:hypothetical protein
MTKQRNKSRHRLSRRLQQQRKQCQATQRHLLEEQLLRDLVGRSPTTLADIDFGEHELRVLSRNKNAQLCILQEKHA